MYDVIIIGGGAAGLFLSANLPATKTLLLESTDKLGKKILISGGGMCNITNMDSSEEFLTHFGDKKKVNFLKPSILNFGTTNTRLWLENHGLDLTIRDDGKVFPKSLKAQSLIDTLHRTGARNGVEYKHNSKVSKIDCENSIFSVTTSKDIYKAKAVVIATGGQSFPNTGSDGSGYKLAKAAGHKIVDPTPALSNIKVLNNPFIKLSGNSVKGSFVEFFRNGEDKRYLVKQGDMLFTHQGLSGPIILNNSRDIMPQDRLQISLIPCNNKENAKAKLISLLTKKGQKAIRTLLKPLGLTSGLIDFLEKKLEIDLSKTTANLNKKDRNRIIKDILEYPITVSSKGGFGSAMVTSGGVNLSQIDRKTMESKLVPGLFFAGEILDIDGDTGGYNIQAAFSTAMLILKSNHWKEYF